MKHIALSASLVALVTFSAATTYADEGAAKPGGDVASSGGTSSSGAAPQAPSCQILSPLNSWKIPVNAPGIPVLVSENSGAKLEVVATISPSAEYTLLADIGSPQPQSYRVFKIKDPKVGDKFEVTLGGTCTGGGPTFTPFVMNIEYVDAAPLPVILGTMAEDPQGTTTLKLDSGFLPFQTLSTITFSHEGAPLGTYPSGVVPSPGDLFGVRACVGGACTAPQASTGSVGLLGLSAALVCKAGRSSGVVEVALSAQAHIPGAENQPSTVNGSIHVDCSKATDAELGKGTGMPNDGVAPATNGNGSTPTGCSVGSLAPVDARLGTFAFGIIGIALIGARRRRAHTSR